MFETLQEFIATAAAAITLLTTIVVLLAKLTNSVKLKKIAEALNFFKTQAEKYVALAEEIVNFKGGDKKEWVLTKINQAAIDAGLNYDQELVSDIIEQTVTLTKMVNKRDKDKEIL